MEPTSHSSACTGPQKAGENSERHTLSNLPPEPTEAALWAEEWEAPAEYAKSLLDKTKEASVTWEIGK